MKNTFPTDFWKTAEENGHVAVNFPSRKAAVYVGGYSEVILAIEDGQEQIVTAFYVTDIDRLIHLLIRSKITAVEKVAVMDATHGGVY